MDRSNDIGTLIKAITNAKDAEENRRLKKYHLSASQMHVLLHLYDAPDHSLSLKALEKAMYVSQSTMAKMVRTLVDEKHLACYESDSDDKRIKRVALTETAIPVCEEVQHIVEEMEKLLQADLSEQEVADFRSYLKRIYTYIEEGRSNEKDKGKEIL